MSHELCLRSPPGDPCVPRHLGITCFSSQLPSELGVINSLTRNKGKIWLVFSLSLLKPRLIIPLTLQRSFKREFLLSLPPWAARSLWDSKRLWNVNRALFSWSLSQGRGLTQTNEALPSQERCAWCLPGLSARCASSSRVRGWRSERDRKASPVRSASSLMSQCYEEGDAVVGCPLDFISTRCHPNEKQIIGLT